MNYIKRLFLNEKLIIIVILINSAVLFLQESGVNSHFLSAIDLTCSIIFLIEMIVKHITFGVRGYWSSGWNRFDGTLVILSLPSILVIVLPNTSLDLSFLLVLRVFRVFRFFRLVHAFPQFPVILRNFMMAMRQSLSIFIGLLVMIITFAMIECSLFREAAPQFFGSPMDSIYTTFRIFTGEGWNEIPDTVAAAMGGAWGHAVRFYFCALLVLGCIIGMSLLNSIFVDAMVSDNNDDVKEQLSRIQSDIDDIKNKLNK